MRLQLLTIFPVLNFVAIILALTIFASSHGSPPLRYGLSLFFLAVAIALVRQSKWAHRLNLLICCIGGGLMLIGIMYPYARIENRHVSALGFSVWDLLFLCAFIASGVVSRAALRR